MHAWRKGSRCLRGFAGLSFVFTIPLLAQVTGLTGEWLGELKAGPQTLRVVLHLTPGGGTFESIDQGATLPLKSVSVEGHAVKVDIGIATFDGTLDPDSRQISGTFHQGPANLPLTFRHVEKSELPSVKRPQEPARPLPYAEEEVTYTGAGGAKLAGTFTYPKTGGPFIAALLITGSGAQDRDETLMGHKPFLVLSDYLTRAGYAVLRVDDRGTGKSEGVFEKTSYSDKSADVLAGIAYLKARKEVNPSRVGVIGHSEGGIIGPIAASQSRDIAFVVMMAGIGIPGARVMKQQGIDIVRASGGDDALVAKQVETQTKLFDIMRKVTDEASARKALVAEFGPGAFAEGQVAAILSPTLRDLVAYDPGPVLRKLSCPVLAIDGAKDLQVSAKLNLPAIAAALAESPSASWATVLLPDLNHLFQTARTGAVSEYSVIQETIAPLALRTITEWLARNVRQ